MTEILPDDNQLPNGIKRAPEELENLMAEWMVEHGPDRHCDGYALIAALAWTWIKQNP